MPEEKQEEHPPPDPVSPDAPPVQRVRSVSDAFAGPLKVVSDSGLPFETSESIANLTRRVSNAALLSTTGAFEPPFPGRLQCRLSLVRTPIRRLCRSQQD
jgi:hypothetical protein